MIGVKKMKTLETMSGEERSLLLFLETRAVDYGGRVNVEHMNQVDMNIAERWNSEGFVGFGRIVMRNHNRDGTHWCKLPEEAWKLAHAERKARHERMWLKRNWITTEESREVNGHPHLSGMNGIDLQANAKGDER